jgi:hypothetical protein
VPPELVLLLAALEPQELVPELVPELVLEVLLEVLEEPQELVPELVLEVPLEPLPLVLEVLEVLEVLLELLPLEPLPLVLEVLEVLEVPQELVPELVLEVLLELLPLPPELVLSSPDPALASLRLSLLRSKPLQWTPRLQRSRRSPSGRPFRSTATCAILTPRCSWRAIPTSARSRFRT